MYYEFFSLFAFSLPITMVNVVNFSVPALVFICVSPFSWHMSNALQRANTEDEVCIFPMISFGPVESEFDPLSLVKLFGCYIFYCTSRCLVTRCMCKNSFDFYTGQLCKVELISLEQE